MVCDTSGHRHITRNFEFLGAAVGNDAFVVYPTATAQRTATAAPVLDAIAKMENRQVALRLVRHSAGFGRLVHSMRCVPPVPQQHALEIFDDKVRGCFTAQSGLPLGAESLVKAERGFSSAGLRLRSTARHAAAAFLVSIGACLHFPPFQRFGSCLAA